MTYVIGVGLITVPSSQEHVIFENILHNRMFLIGFYTITLLHFASIFCSHCRSLSVQNMYYGTF